MANQFTAWLRREIQNHLWTIAQFAANAGVSEDTVDKWLSGRHRPNGISIVRIAKALGLSRDEVEAHLDNAATTAA